MISARRSRVDDFSGARLLWCIHDRWMHWYREASRHEGALVTGK